MISQDAYVHPNAIVDVGASVGARSRIWAFAHLASGACVGEDCNVCDHTFVEGNVRVGNRTTIKCGVYLWNGVSVGDDVLIGPCAAFTNDLRPRSGQRGFTLSKTSLMQGCSIGANSTILPVTIGQWAMVAAGAVVTRDVSAHSLVVGHPAKFRAWLCRCGEILDFKATVFAVCRCGVEYRLCNDQVVEV